MEQREDSAGQPLPMERVLYEVKKVIVGQDHLLERLVVALLARGHILVEGVPGLAKTMAIKTLAEAIGGEFKRIQFTPDLVPADLVGTRIYNQKTGEFNTSLGPVFTNLLLADEINRAPAKVQSALLEVMQERQVTIGRETFPVPNPFLVLATQNPIETEGTYALPEAQVDRFMLKVLVGYPTADRGVRDRRADDRHAAGGAGGADDRAADRRCRSRPTGLRRPGADRICHQRGHRHAAAEGGRPAGARALHHLRGEPARVDQPDPGRRGRWPSCAGASYVLPQDVLDIVLDVLRHRLVLSYEALSDNVTADDLIQADPRPHTATGGAAA